MAHLFEPLAIRGVTLRNRIGVAPMCMYSSDDGFATDWHVMHLGARAAGGAGLVITEAAAVEARGRISPQDLGIWKDEHIEGLSRITHFMRSQGAASAVQLAHAGRKASTYRPFDSLAAANRAGVPDDEGGWTPIAPSAEPFNEYFRKPEAATSQQITEIIDAWGAAARRAVEAGFDVIEIHAAHGYLIHEFLSPLSNHRTDGYGGSFENRACFALEVTRAVRAAMPDAMPLFVRISCTDWTEGGWSLEESIALSHLLKSEGVDLIDCSSGGNVNGAKIPVGPNYQVPFAERIRRDADLMTAAVGLISEPMQADAIIRTGQADMALLAREMLRDPHWPLRAARMLGHADAVRVPPQYRRGYA